MKISRFSTFQEGMVSAETIRGNTVYPFFLLNYTPLQIKKNRENALRKIDLYVHWHCSSLSQLWPKTIWASSLVWTFLWVDLANSTLLMQQNVGQTLTFRNSEKDRKKIVFVKYLGQASIRCKVGSLNSGRLKVPLNVVNLCICSLFWTQPPSYMAFNTDKNVLDNSYGKSGKYVTN